MNEPEMNVEMNVELNVVLLTQVRDAILANPGNWFSHVVDEESIVRKGYLCNTPSCVAGWGIHIGAPHLETIPVWKVDGKAQKLFGLTDDQAEALFDPVPWEYIEGFDDDKEPEAWETAFVIDHLIATGEVNWSIVPKEKPVDVPNVDAERWKWEFKSMLELAECLEEETVENE